MYNTFALNTVEEANVLSCADTWFREYQFSLQALALAFWNGHVSGSIPGFSDADAISLFSFLLFRHDQLQSALAEAGYSIEDPDRLSAKLDMIARYVLRSLAH